MIFNIEFVYQDGNIIDKKVKVIPTSISSVNNINDYKPTPLIEEEYDRVLEKIQKNSVNINLK